VATVRFETAPGHQLQIDFGERRVVIGGREMRVYFFVTVLGYSRRIYVRAFLRERHDDWREGLAGAFLHFGGVTQTVLVDNARATPRRASCTYTQRSAPSAPIGAWRHALAVRTGLGRRARPSQASAT
jgi:transposase